ncbi:MAG: hypothetical protein GPJ18_10490 [Microcystis aeruginosa F13-15]|nr:hypothetical protein [Microcystis aeruginosa F13-15]
MGLEVSYQLSVISYQLSVISYQFTEKTPYTPHPTPYTLHPTCPPDVGGVGGVTPYTQEKLFAANPT